MAVQEEWCDRRHVGIDTELMRIRERLDGVSGNNGLCGRLKEVELNMKDFADVKRAVRTQSILLIVLALLTGIDVIARSPLLLKLIP